MGRAGHSSTSSLRSWSAGAVASLPRPECTRTWLYSCYIQYMHVPCAHAPCTRHGRRQIAWENFFLCAMGSTMSRQLNLFGKPVVKKAGPYRSSSNRYEKFVNAYIACNPGGPVCLWRRPSAKQTMRGERRGMEKTRKKWRWCCRLMLLLRRRTRDSLGAVLSWINEVLRKDDIDYCQKMCDKPFG